MEENLKHVAVYGGKINLYRAVTIVALIISVAAGVAASILSEETYFNYLVTACVVAVIFTLTFLVLWFQAANRKYTLGSFEKIDVINNRIIYQTEKSGERIITPENIESLKIYNTDARHTDDSYYNMKIKMKDNDEPFYVSRWVSDYREFVQKMRTFKDNNNLPG